MKQAHHPHASDIRHGLWLGTLGESIDVVSTGFGLAVIAVVFVGRRMPAHTSP